MPPRIVIIHAMRAAMAPIENSFRCLWPEAETIQFLDESLSVEMARARKLTPAMFERIEKLAAFGVESEADAILYSCSAFGKAIEAVNASLDIPVLKPNEAMLEDALQHGATIRLSATFFPSIPSMRMELEKMALAAGRQIQIETCHVPGALDALNAGNFEKHDMLIAEALADRKPCDVEVLAQFSMARARDRVAGRVEAKVLSSPESAVRKLQQVLAQRNGVHLPARISSNSKWR